VRAALTVIAGSDGHDAILRPRGAGLYSLDRLIALSLLFAARILSASTEASPPANRRPYDRAMSRVLSLVALSLWLAGCRSAAAPLPDPTVYGEAWWNHPAAVIPEDAWAPMELPEANPRRLLIQKSMLLDGNEVLLVDEPETASRLYRLLRGNSVVAHACAYHWLLTFETGEQQFESVPFNQECEQFRNANAEIQRLVRAYTEQIETRPAQYLLDLAISPTAEVAPVLRRLTESRYRALLLRRQSWRFPSVRVETAAAGPLTGDDDIPPEVQREAEERLEQALELLRQRGHLLEHSPIRQAGVAYMNERGVYAATTDVVLSRAFRPEDVEAYPADISFCDYYVPSEYVLHLVLDEPFSPAVERRLRELVPSALRVSPSGAADVVDAEPRDLRCRYFSDLD
jgi:hypothetical protein